MGKRSGGTRGTNSSNSSKSRKGANGSARDIETARKQYDEYIHGSSYSMDDGRFDKVDLLAKPLAENTTLYRGGSSEELDSMMEGLGLTGDYKRLIGKTFIDKHLKSTTKRKSDADDYKSDAYDANAYYEENGMPLVNPVTFHYNVAKGVKVVDRKGLGFDTSGRGAKEEFTLAHNQSYTVTRIRGERQWDGTTELDVYIDVKPHK